MKLWARVRCLVFWLTVYNSFRVLFDKIASVYCIWKIYLYFRIGNGWQPRQPALCQLYWHTSVPCVGRLSTVRRLAGEETVYPWRTRAAHWCSWHWMPVCSRPACSSRSDSSASPRTLQHSNIHRNSVSADSPNTFAGDAVGKGGSVAEWLAC